MPGICFNPRSDVTLRKATGATDVDQDPYPTSQYVLWAYRLLLGREPEDPQAVELYPETSRRRLVEAFISSPEFLGNQIRNVCSYHGRYMVELEDGLTFWLISGEIINRRGIAGRRHIVYVDVLAIRVDPNPVPHVAAGGAI